MKTAEELLLEMSETPFKIIVSINQTKIYKNLKILVLSIVIALHVRTLALGGIYHGDKIGIFAFYSGTISKMFEIKKYWNKISQTDWYLHFRIHCLTLDLFCFAVLGTSFFFGLFLP